MSEHLAEVRVRWGDTLLDVQHVRPSQDAAPGLPRVVTHHGAHYCVLPAEASAQLVDGGVIQRAVGTYVPLGASTTVHVAQGALVYSFRLAALPPAAPRQSSVPRAPLGWLLVSFVAHAVLVVAFSFVPPRAALGTATPLVRYPPARVEPEPETWTFGRRGGRNGERHALEQGALGSPEIAPVRAGHYAVAGRTESSRRSLARPPLRRDATRTPADVLGASLGTWSAPSSPFSGERARGPDATSALGAMMGDFAGDASGALGLGMVGTGRGGGGAGLGTVGLAGSGALGTRGDATGCSGCFGSGFGRGAGGLRGREVRPEPRLRASQTSSSGLDRETVRRVVQEHRAEIRYCYEQGLVRNPSLDGRVIIHWVVTPSGQVTSGSLVSSTLRDSIVAACMVQSVRRWTFPAASTETTVRYPFVLRAS